MRSVLTGCLPLVVAVGLPSQTTHLVGPGGLPQIRDALAIAAPGDIVDVLPGTYAHFDANVGVTIRALTPGTVTVAYDIAFMPSGCPSNLACTINEGPTRLQPSAGQVLHVAGVRFAGNTATPPGFNVPYLHRVVIAGGGRVTLDSCEVRAIGRPPLSVSNTTVHLQDTLLAEAANTTFYSFPGHSALLAIGAHVTAIGCTFHGGSASGSGGFGAGSGAQLQGSVLHGSHLLMTGGTWTATLGGAAVYVDGTSRAWLSDSSLIAGPGNCAISSAPNNASIDRCTLTSNTTGCTSGTTIPFLLGVERPNPLQRATTFALRYRTEPNGFVGVFVSGGLATDHFPGLLEQPSWLAANGAFVATLVGADATGLATASWPIPAGPFADLTLWFEGMSGFTLPLQVSPPAGGVVR